jgi:peroxiredoxin Q/BCP
MPSTQKKSAAKPASPKSTKKTSAKPLKTPAAKKPKAAPKTSASVASKSAPVCRLALTGNKTVDLASFKGKKHVVLYFYPKDDTPGCTIEANDFAALNAQFEKANAVVIGISKDDLKSHDKFRAKYKLPFALASDDSGIAEAFGAWGEKNMYGKKYMGIVRSTFLIDISGKIVRSWPKVNVTGHAAEVLAAVKAL